MKSMMMVVGITTALVAQSASAVTPAHLAMRQVRAYFERELESAIGNAVPFTEAALHLVSFQTNLMRGKFSSQKGGFSDFFGDTSVMVQVGETDAYYELQCHHTASAMVVPFAMQQHPILEESPEEQLILKRHNVGCRLQ